MTDLTAASLESAFSDCDDLIIRPVLCCGHALRLYAIDGLVASAFASQYILQPITECLEGASMQQLYENALSGQIYNCVAKPCPDLQDACMKLVSGFCLVLFPGVGAIAFEVRGGDRRGVSPPTVENTVKGPKDAFTETLRVNTALLRRHLRTPDLRLFGMTVGSHSRSYVTVVWLHGVTDPALVARLKLRLESVRDREFLTPAAVEEAVTGGRAIPFPLLQYTERTDKFAQGLLGGRVGLLVDGLPLGYLLPVDLGYLMYSPEDYGASPLAALFIRVLRYCALGVSLLLPGLYMALCAFHHELIPLPLLRSIIETRKEVPFSVFGEILALLLAFELLQEAGVHLPRNIGPSVSIIGGIVVGSAAVEAGIVSPVALIVVSVAGICGYALPNRDLAEAIRLCRLALVAIGALAGLFGVCAGVIWLVCHLAKVDSLGHPYLAPFANGCVKGVLPNERGGKE